MTLLPRNYSHKSQVTMRRDMQGNFQLVPETQCTAFEVKDALGALLPRWRRLSVPCNHGLQQRTRQSLSMFVRAIREYLCGGNGCHDTVVMQDLNADEMQGFQEITEQLTNV